MVFAPLRRKAWNPAETMSWFVNPAIYIYIYVIIRINYIICVHIYIYMHIYTYNIHMLCMYIYIYVYIYTLLYTKGAGHQQIWEDPIVYHMFAQKWCMANLGGLMLKGKLCMCTGMTYDITFKRGIAIWEGPIAYLMSSLTCFHCQR